MKPDLLKVLGCLLLTKLTLFLVSWTSIHAHANLAITLNPFASHTPLFAWDSLRYLEILNNGYPLDRQHLYEIAFFPLYPLCAYPLSRWIGGPAALLVVSNLASLVGYSLFYLWCERRAGARTALFASLAAICYPPAFFASCAYTEGLFVLFIAAVLLLLELRRIPEAAIVAGLASALRPPAVTLGILVALTSLTATGSDAIASLLKRLVLVTPAIALVGLSGAIAYETYLAVRFDDPLIYFTSQKRWDIVSAPQDTSAGAAVSKDRSVDIMPGKPKEVLRQSFMRLFDKAISIGGWNRIWMVLMVALTLIAMWRPGPVPVATFLVPIGIFLLTYLPGHGARAFSVGRFMVGALPTFLWLGSRIKNHPRWALAGLAACWLLQIRLVWAFSQGAWAG